MLDTDRDGKSLGNYSILGGKTPTAESTVNVRQAEVAPSHGRSGALWAVLTVLAVALAVVAGYDYSVFRRHNVQLAQLPGVVDSLTGVSKRLADSEAKLSAWSTQQDALGERVSRLETKVTASLHAARKQTQVMMAQFREELNQRTQVIDARLSRVESANQAEHAELAKLQEQIIGARQEIASTRQEIDGVRSGELASLGQQETQSQKKLEAISNQLDRQRVDFEVAKNETRELVPGISLRILRTNASYQRFAGYVVFVPDSRTLWIPDQGVQQPLAFRRKEGGEPYELVVTGVNKRSVAGYMLIPTTAPEGARALAEGGLTDTTLSARSSFSK